MREGKVRASANAGLVSGRRGRLVTALVVLAFAAACTPLPTYRYKLTVEVDTPEGVRSGYSVIEVRAWDEPQLLPEMGGASTRVIGEAVAVPLPDGQVLFATLESRNPYGYPGGLARKVLVPSEPPGSFSRPDGYARTAAILAEQKRRAIVPPSAYPVFVTFEDGNRPETINYVDPLNLVDDFGDGYALRRVVVESSQDPVTRKIAEYLPWLLQAPARRMRVEIDDRRRMRIGAEDFRTGA